MGRLDYTMVTRHRWLWPLVDLGAVILFTIREIALKHEARRRADVAPTANDHPKYATGGVIPITPGATIAAPLDNGYIIPMAQVRAAGLANLRQLKGRPSMATAEQAWRKAIADQVRRNCTPSSEAYAQGSDALIAAVADWIENPPEWSKVDAPEEPNRAGTITAKLVLDTTEFDAALEHVKNALEALHPRIQS